MTETRFLSFSPLLRGALMKIAAVTFEPTEDIEVDADAIPGVVMVSSGTEGRVTMLYVDSPVYQRLTVLAVARIFGKVRVISKYALMVTRGHAAFRDESMHVPVIQSCINWAASHAEAATTEEAQTLGLLAIGAPDDTLVR